MGQWKALEELGKHVDEYDLLANVYSHCLMWRELKERILPVALVSSPRPLYFVFTLLLQDHSSRLSLYAW